MSLPLPIRIFRLLLDQQPLLLVQPEDIVNCRVEGGFQPHNFACQTLDFGGSLPEQLFPIVAFLERDVAFEDFDQFGAEEAPGSLPATRTRSA